MYLGRPGVHLPELPPEHKFIRGNHDDPQLCREHPNYLGDYGYLPDDNLFFLSGALTASWRVLQNSKYWFADEQLSDTQLGEALELYARTKPSLVVSHDGPSEAACEVLKDLHGNYYDAKRGGIESRTCAALQEMFEIHQPEVWFFGHYHVKREFALRGTNFLCLTEMGTTGVRFGVDAPLRKTQKSRRLPERTEFGLFDVCARAHEMSKSRRQDSKNSAR